MKKRLIKFLTFLFAAIICVSAAGCNLVTKNNQKDMEQVIATVNVNNEEKIYKRDLVMAYLNYGYVYVQYYGYSQERTLNMILDSLIESHLIYQEAMNVFEEDADYAKNASVQTKYTSERYLTEDEILTAEYNACVAINNLLDSYSDEEAPAENKDTLGETVRTVPTDASNAEKELTSEEKRAYIEKGFDVSSNEYRRKALASVVKMLQNNNLLGDKYTDNLKDTDYYTQIYNTYLQQEVISNYEEYVLKGIRGEILSYDKLKEAYSAKRTEQENWSNEDFVSALSSATAANPVLYSKNGTYGYIYNLLLGVNSYQSAEIESLSAEKNLTETERAERLADILNGTTVKDLRSTWILSGYDFDGEKFTGDYTFAKNPENSLPFKGEVKLLKEATEDDAAVYGVEEVYTYGLDEFVKLVNGYVYGDENIALNGGADISVYGQYNCNTKPEEYENKINELLFAFSTDPGSLNTYKGYVVKPLADGSASEEYVKTFGNAGRELLSMGNASYMIVASDFGYHVIFFSEVFNADYGFNTLDDYLNSLGIQKEQATWEEYFNAMVEDWEAFEESNTYLYLLANELSSSKTEKAVTENRTAIVNKYVYGEDSKVTVYTDRFSDLFGN